MYAGLIVLEDSLLSAILVKNSSGVPINADALPTFRVYGPDGYLVSGTCTLLDSGTITGATNASPIVITSAGHGLSNGARVTVASVGGNTAANGTFKVANVTSDTFELSGSTGNGSYTSGGTWNATGAYRYTIPCLGADGFAAGENYNVIFNFAISSSQQGLIESFTVT